MSVEFGWLWCLGAAVILQGVAVGRNLMLCEDVSGLLQGLMKVCPPLKFSLLRVHGLEEICGHLCERLPCVLGRWNRLIWVVRSSLTGIRHCATGV